MKTWKRVLAMAAVLLAACTVMGSSSASVGKVMQELEYRNIKVTLNGKALDLRNAAGDTVEPFLFGGTNYLPVRALAEALGLEVSWDGASSTVALKEPEKKVQWLEDRGTLGNSAVEISGAVLAWAWDDDNDEYVPAIVITYFWTNQTDQRTYAMSEIRESAYQDGEKLEYASIGDKTVYDVGTSFKEVRPGTRVQVQAGYVLKDTAVPVEFELTERSAVSDSPDAYVFHDFLLDSASLPPMPDPPSPDPGPQENV